MKIRKKVLFFILRNLHLPHLMPIYHWMKDNMQDECEPVFSTAPYQPSEDGQPGYGLEPERERKLIASGASWIPPGRILSFKPDVVVMADSCYNTGVDQIGAKQVNVNHGLISKGYYYTDSPIQKRENAADLICVAGPYHKTAMQKLVTTPIVVTGLVKFDRFVNGEITRESVLKGMNINPAKKVILFAPTFNNELSAVPMVTDTVRKWVDDSTHLLIKLHGMAPPEWVELYKLISQIDPRITLVEDIDLTPSLVAADVMVSDVSSAFMEFIALDKPVVLVNNPLRIRYSGFDPRDIEYSWRNVGDQVDCSGEILDAIKHVLANPHERSEQRRLAGARLAGSLDGRASERAARAIAGVIGSDFNYSPHPESIGAISSVAS